MVAVVRGVRGLKRHRERLQPRKFGRFPQLSDREDLLQILVMVRARKVCDQTERRAVR